MDAGESVDATLAQSRPEKSLMWRTSKYRSSLMPSARTTTSLERRNFRS
jgi:hypothetical protein